MPFIIFHEYEENDTWVDYEYRCREFSHRDFVLKTEVEFNQYHADKKIKWFTDYPTGIAYVVHCLDGGAWDRPTWWGDFSSLEEAKACCENGPSWKIKMSRRYFKKNVDQTDLFDLESQLNEIRQLRVAESELNMTSSLGQAELNLVDTRKKRAANWMQLSVDSIFDND